MTETAVFLTHPHVPIEIISFFGKSTTSSLLVKGLAGTGKTTFALEMIEVMSSFENVYYVSTRVSNEALYRHYPWLREKELHAPHKARVPAAKAAEKEMAFITPGDYFSKEKFMYAGIRRLEEERKEEPAPKPRQERSLNFETPYLDRLGRREAIPDIEAVYRKVNDNIPNKSFFVLDSLKGLVGKYHLEPEELIFTLQKDLVERNYADLLVVMEERDPTPVDFLVDGVVEQRIFEEGGRRFRTMNIQKLRGEEIRQPDYLLTLHGGHFRSFQPFTPVRITGGIKCSPIIPPSGYYSTGSPTLDEILGSGFPVGSNVLLEIGNAVPNEAARLLVTNTILHFLVSGGGVMFTPFAGTTHAQLSEMATATGLENEFRNHMVLTAHAGGAKEVDINVLPLEFKDIEEDAKKILRARKGLEERTRKGILEVVGVETVVSRHGTEAYSRELDISAEGTAQEGNLTVRITTSDESALKDKVSAISDIHIGLMEFCGSILLYGVKPKTRFYHVSWKAGAGNLLPTFVPIV